MNAKIVVDTSGNVPRLQIFQMRGMVVKELALELDASGDPTELCRQVQELQAFIERAEQKLDARLTRRGGYLAFSGDAV